MTVVPTVRLFVARSCELFGFGKVPELEGTMSIAVVPKFIGKLGRVSNFN